MIPEIVDFVIEGDDLTQMRQVLKQYKNNFNYVSALYISLVRQTMHVFRTAVQNGDLELLRYMHENLQYPWSANLPLADDAAGRGHIECLQYVHDHGSRMNLNTRKHSMFQVRIFPS